MANSKARCQGCRSYRPREELTRVGLGSVCLDDPDCRRAVLDRQKERGRERDTLKMSRGQGRVPSKTRKAVRNRDVSCRFCGQSYPLEQHHILYRSQGGPDAYWNLILLCDTHHRLAHSKKRYWQPILLAYIWLFYVEGKRNLTVPIVERILKQRGLLPALSSDPDDGQMID